MVDDRQRVTLLPVLQKVPADLALVVLLIICMNFAVFLPGINDTALVVVLGLPFTLFVPGYAFGAALFADSASSAVTSAPAIPNGPSEASEIDTVERVVLAFGLSIVVVSVAGLGLAFSPWGVQQEPLTLILSGFTLIAAGIGTVRRLNLPADERFALSYRRWLQAVCDSFSKPLTKRHKATSAILILAILLAVATIGFVVGAPNQGEQFSELYLLTEGENSELRAGGYPKQFTVGQSQPLYVGIHNHEYQTVRYNLILIIQNATITDSGPEVFNEQRLRRFQITLKHNETWRLPHDVSPTLAGDRLRLTYLLYKGTEPSDPNLANADEEVHLWVNVTDTAN